MFQENKIKKIIFEKTPIDRVIAITNQGNFCEVIGKAGKDVLTYRVYENGTIAEK